ncbi:MAG: B12-binding domain-containing radical SAM protein [Syntrophales bacterium]
MSETDSRCLRVAIVVPAKKLFFVADLGWIQRYGPLQVASVTRQAGYFVRLFNEELGLRVDPGELAREFDVVGFSSKTAAITRAEKLAGDIKREAEKIGRSVVTVLGGEHISLGGESRFSPHFDYMLRGESEEAFLTLLKALESKKGVAPDLSGVSFDKSHICESFDNIPDLSLVVGYDETVQGFLFKHLPLVWMLKNRKLPVLTFQMTRGCPYNCSFCPTSFLSQGKGYRRRRIESSVQYLREHIAKSGVRRVFFEDPTAALPFDKRSHLFFEALAANPTGMQASLLVRNDLYEDRILLEKMRAAGVHHLCVGIESLTDQTLSDFRKKTSYETIRKSVEVFHEHGFTIMGLFIVGYDTDDPDTFERIRSFIKETGIEKWRITPWGQLPETPGQFMPAHRCFLWDEFAPFGRELADYINGEFVFFYPKHMKPSTLQKKIAEFNRSATSFTDVVRIFMRRGKLISVFRRVGNNIAQTMLQKEVRASAYLEMIQEVEGQFYLERDGRESLQEDLLLKRYQARELTRGKKSLAAS